MYDVERLPKSSAFGILMGPDGDVLWCDHDSKKHEAIASLEGREVAPLWKHFLHGNEEVGVKASEVFEEAEKLRFVSRKGCPKGFVTILPRGCQFTNAVNNYSAKLVGRLGAVEMVLPTVYAARDRRIVELTQHYEDQGRVYHVGTNERLCYAADPNLFMFLSGRRLVRKRLPFTVCTPTHFIRNFQNGEVNGLNRTKEFSFPEIHTFVTIEDFRDAYENEIRLSTEGARYWFGHDWVHKCDIRTSFLISQPGLMEKLAQASGTTTYFRVLPQIPIYYDIKTQILVDAGFGTVMIYNMQWDRLNGERFDIRTNDGQAVGIIHGTMIGPTSRLLPALLGRALVGNGPSWLPAEVCFPHLHILLFAHAYGQTVERLKSVLGESGIDFVLVEVKHLATDLAKLRADRNQWFTVLGHEQVDMNNVIIQSTDGIEKWTMERWLSHLLPRIKLCSPGNNLRGVELPW